MLIVGMANLDFFVKRMGKKAEIYSVTGAGCEEEFLRW
jgi:hypothetical protein